MVGGPAKEKRQVRLHGVVAVTEVRAADQGAREGGMCEKADAKEFHCQGAKDIASKEKAEKD